MTKEERAHKQEIKEVDKQLSGIADRVDSLNFKNRKGNRSRRVTEQQARIRAIEIFRQRIQGKDLAEIAKNEGISIPAVYWYVKKYQKQVDHKVKTLTAKTMAGLLLSNADERSRQLWSIALDEQSTKSQKLYALKLLSDEDDRILKHMQSLELVHQKVDELKLNASGEIEFKHVLNLDEKEKSKLDELLRAGLERQNTSQSSDMGVTPSQN